MELGSARPVDYVTAGRGLLRLALAKAVLVLSVSWAVGQDRPLIHVPQPIVPGDLSADFAIGDPTLVGWNEPGMAATEPQALWQQQTAPPPEDWRQPAAGPMPAYNMPITPVSDPDELVDPEWEVPNYSTAQSQPGRLTRPRANSRRDGFFQRFALRETYLPGSGISDFGIASTDVSLTVALPFPSREMPLILTPAFGAHLLDGPEGVDLPSRLYDNSLKLQTMFKINERWGANIAVTPGWYSDFDSSNDEALRVTGHAFAAWDQSPHVQWIFGVVYLDWQNISLLPAAGVVIKPDHCTRIELTFPRPRYSQRIACTLFGEVWWYVAGELGGGTWAIRNSGGDDLVTISDYRLLFGIENQGVQGLSTYIEAGYVFGREIEFEGATPDFDPGDTLMLRAGLTY